MKTLILVRHGKSSWEHDVSDIQRPLKKRGIRDAINVSVYLNDLPISVDAIYSSPANRAFSTCRIFMQTLGFSIESVEKIDDLYDFEGIDVLKVVKAVNNTNNTIIVFGHNHAFTNLVNRLGSEYIDNLPTSGMAIIDFETDDWSKIENGTTREIVIPKKLR